MVKTPQCRCPHAKILFSLLGKKWVMFILEAVYHGAHSFTEIRKSIGEANTKILTDRLLELIEYGIILKEDGKYLLSPQGEELVAKIIDITDWW